MNIIAGLARNVELSTPDSMKIRPTAGRARKALFDSLGPLEGAGVADLCAGSGAFALEAASRGAGFALLVEKQSSHIRYIEDNIRRVQRTGVETRFQVVNGDIAALGCYASFLSQCDVIFADPPYAVSAELFQTLLQNEQFLRNAEHAQLIWEIPDTPGAAGAFLETPGLPEDMQLRQFGGTLFFLGTVGA